MSPKNKIALGLVVVVLAISLFRALPRTPPPWTSTEIAVLQSLSLSALPSLPPDASNAVADNPAAALLGKKLFFDVRLSANGAVSCATCHQVERRFTDGLQKAEAIGITDRHTPSIVGAAYSPWQFWDGRADSQWAQALAPLEDINEHAIDRSDVVRLVAEDADYQRLYVPLFGVVADTNVAFANIGKAIAAYERTLMPSASRFDQYVALLSATNKGDTNASEAASSFSNDEIWGLRLFIGEASCTQCHNGPLLTNHEFHNTGVISFPGDAPDKARVEGVRKVLGGEFNCRSVYSDAEAATCPELEFTRTGPELIGAFKTPSLRNIDGTAPFMHKGQLATIEDVLRHYNDAPDAMIGHNEAKPLGLSKRELRQLAAFMETLAAPVVERHAGGSAEASVSDTISSL